MFCAPGQERGTGRQKVKETDRKRERTSQEAEEGSAGSLWQFITGSIMAPRLKARRTHRSTFTFFNRANIECRPLWAAELVSEKRYILTVFIYF